MGAKNGHHTLSDENLKALSQSSGLEEIEIVQMFEDFLKKNFFSLVKNYYSCKLGGRGWSSGRINLE